MTHRKIAAAANIFLPTLAFYACYYLFGLLPAIIISILYSLAVLLFCLCKTKKLRSSQLMGLFGLTASGLAVFFTGYSNFYYVPALFNNLVLTFMMLTLALRKRSILHYLARDFEIKALSSVPETLVLGLNYVWMAYFLLKILSKLLGIFFLDFDKLYWLVFWLGDPAAILLVIFSIWFIRRKIHQAAMAEGSTKP